MRKELRVLLVEDMPADVELIRFELKRRGLEPQCSVADSRDQFIRQLELNPPDIILSDHGVPGFDGYAALAIAREKVPTVPFLFVTGAEALPPSPDHRWEADGYVTKANLRQLVPAIEQVFEKRTGGDETPGVAHPVELERGELQLLAKAMGEEILKQSRKLEDRLAGLEKPGNAAAHAEALVEQARTMQKLAEQLVVLAEAETCDDSNPKEGIADVVREAMQRVVQQQGGRRVEWTFRPFSPFMVDSVRVPMILGALLDAALALTEELPVPTLEIAASETVEELLLWVGYKGGTGVMAIQELQGLLQSGQPTDSRQDRVTAPAILARRLAHSASGRTWAEPTDDGGGRLFCALPRRNRRQSSTGASGPAASSV